MAAVPNESGFILEVPLKRYCAKVKGEQFAARFGDPAQFVVLEVGRFRPLVGTVGQVAVGVFHRHQQEDGAAFARTVRYYPSGRQDAFKSKVGFTLQKLRPYIGLTGRPAAAAALQEIQGFRQQLSFELVVQIEHIASAYDVALADFNRGRMQHRPGRF